MSSLTLTILISTGVIILCAVFMAIGKLITGKDKFSCKRCGKPEDDSKCSVCKKTKKNPPFQD